MAVKIYNSLTRKKQELPPPPQTIKMYACGVTVYDDCHIGHARSLYIFDVIVRYLRFRGYKVNFIRNITDIDDKIINRAKEVNEDWEKLSQRYIESYYKDLDNLGIVRADAEPKATENIKAMIKHIQGLIKKDFAYEADGSIYFRVRNFKDYGKLSGQSIDQMRQGVRIDRDEKKEDPLDFALWKKSKEGEPSWPSPWGNGRPGWHIECSVMSQKYLKTETLDIHGGGRDLIFPHHENEIAQAEALTGKPFVKVWIHHGLLTINGQKMAKSLGNFVTIKDMLSKYSPDILKLFYLQGHYSSVIDFSWDKMQEYQKQNSAFNYIFELNRDPGFSRKPDASLSVKEIKITDELSAKFEQAMDDDFNMPQALACLFKLRDQASGFEVDAFDYARSKLETFFKIFGLTIRSKIPLNPELKKMAKEREEARGNKDFVKADIIRKEIKRKFSVNVSDTKTGTIFTETEL